MIKRIERKKANSTLYPFNLIFNGHAPTDDVLTDVL